MRLLVDSGVWIALFRGESSPQVSALESAVTQHIVLIGDLILHEVLRGMPDEASANSALEEFEQLEAVRLGGQGIAVAAARNYRALRSRGITIRSAVDMLIGTWCIANAVSLLHNDRDFAPLELHFGLKRWPAHH